jgi:hypothetical protein
MTALLVPAIAIVVAPVPALVATTLLEPPILPPPARVVVEPTLAPVVEAPVHDHLREGARKRWRRRCSP